jgi:DNA-binding SARP family transcriptional activator
MVGGATTRGRGFYVLGTVEARDEHGTIGIGGVRAHCLLACLLLNAGRVVGIDRLVDAVWDDRPPSGARIQVQNRISTLRTRLRAGGLGADLIVRQAPGYLLRLDGVRFDLHDFDAAVARADRLRAAGRLADASDALRSAVDLWHGPALNGLDTTVLRTAAGHLEERRLQALESRLRADLELGRHPDVVAQLDLLVQQHPYRESLVDLLMRALAGTGRRSAAVDVYQRLRKQLADELGIDPGEVVQNTFRAVLRAPAPEQPRRRATVPAQLPADIPFAGRTAELGALDAVLPDAPGHRGTVVLTGTAGVGKSALAVHWAHRVAGRFPDGQLYLSLRGFSPYGQPMATDEAVRTLLDALEAPARDVPVGLPAQIGMYRSLMAGRRMLLVLDDARDADQVRRLLPGSPGCLTVVTSRDSLSGLAVTEGARLIRLDTLTGGEARTLLAQRIGPGPVTAEPDAVAAIVAECSSLPLALAVAAARIAAGPERPLARFAERLRAGRGTLDAFAGPDRPSDVRAVFSLSYRELSPGAARLFRLLHLRVGGRIATPAVASLAGVGRGKAAALLAELAAANLVTRRPPDHVTMHDLLHSYAGELSAAEDPEADRQAAWLRLLDHLTLSALAADHVTNPRRLLLDLADRRPGVVAERFADDGAAHAWFRREAPVLLEAVSAAADRGPAEHAWKLAWALTTYLNRTGHWAEWARAQRAGLAAAVRSGDLSGQAHCHRDLANALTRLRDYDAARRHMRQALDHYDALGDRAEQSSCHANLAWTEERDGRYAEALAHARTRLRLVETHHIAAHTGSALNLVGWCHALVGDHEQAITFCRQALPHFQQARDRYGEAHTWDSLGYAAQHLHRHDEALEHYARAVALCEEIGERYLTGQVLTRIGDTHTAAGRPAAARAAWRRALAVFEEIDPRDAAAVRAKLAAAGAPAEVPTAG